MLTIEEKKKRACKASNRYRQKLTPEQKLHILELRRKRIANETPEKRNIRLQQQRAHNSTEMAKEKHREYSKKYQRKLASTPEGKEQLRLKHFEQKYGMTKLQLDSLFKKQGSQCAICETKEAGSKKGWHTDHCHRKNNVRGILCHGCNIMLGYAKDDPQILKSAARYLQFHQKEGK